MYLIWLTASTGSWWSIYASYLKPWDLWTI